MKKYICDSALVISQIMLPSQANFSGNIHGGEIIKLMDSLAYAVARRHCAKNVVTARVDELQFHMPIYIEDLVTLRGKLIFVGSSSMQVAVSVTVEQLDKEEKPKQALTAYFTLVAVDKEGKATSVPGLILDNAQEEKEYQQAEERYLFYKKKRL